MKTSRRILLAVEQLEQRDCPALTISVIPGTLVIQGTPAGALAINGTATPGQIQVVDNGRTLGTYSGAGNLIVNLASEPSTVAIDVNPSAVAGQKIGGNILLSLGLGGPSIDPVSIADGTIGGTLTILNGSGQENLELGRTIGGVTAPLTVGGSVSAVGRVSGGPTGDSLTLFPGTTVKGNLSTTQIDNVTLEATSTPTLSTVAGNLSVNDAGANIGLDVTINGVVGKNVSVTGTQLDDTFTLGQVGGAGGTIGGSLSVNLQAGNGPVGDVISLGGGTVVNGNTTLTSAGGPSGGLYEIMGTVNGNLTVNMGTSGSAASGLNNVLLFQGMVFGHMQVTAGNGDNDLGDNVTPFSGTVFGNLSFNLGHGNDTAVITNAPFGTLNWFSGNGMDLLQLGEALTPTPPGLVWNVNVHFGTGSDTLSLNGDPVNSNPEYLTGIVDLGGTFGSNTLIQGTNWILAGPLQLYNV